MRELILAAAKAAEEKGPPNLSALIGFDGFVDEIIHVVDKRYDFESYTPIETIAAFAERIGRAAGLSTNIELVPTAVKLGGNGPIMANALRSLNFDITYIGCLGEPEIHPVFQELAANARCYSIADPGHTDALEFRDGKLMFGKHQSLKNATWEKIIATVGEDNLREILGSVHLAAFVNWTMMPYMTEIWNRLTEDFLPKLPVREPKPWCFFDLADPEKRSYDELAEAVHSLSNFASHFRPVLGLNRKEATEVSIALGLDLGMPPQEAPLSVIVPAIAEALPKLAGVVVHPTTEAACVFDGKYYYAKGATTSRPKLTTGAGDNFNAGFCAGLMLELEPDKALILGKGTAGYYVRNGRSPHWNELLDFLALWADRIDEEF